MAAAVIVLPMFVLHFLDKRRPFGIGTKSRTMLMKGIVCRFLHYSNESRSNVLDGDLIMAAARDSVSLVQQGYKNLLNVVRDIGQLAAVTAIQFLAPHLFGHKIRWHGLVPLLAFPIFLSVFLRFRLRRTTRVLDDEQHWQDEIVDLLTDTIENYGLVSDYKCQGEALKRCEDRFNQYHVARKEAKRVKCDNMYFPQFLTTVALAFYTVVGGLAVMNGDTPMGMYLTNIRIFDSMGGNYKSIYTACLEIQSVFPSLLRITLLLNLPTNLPSHMKVIHNAHEQARKLTHEMSKSKDGRTGQVLDRLPISMGGFKFSYGSTISRVKMWKPEAGDAQPEHLAAESICDNKDHTPYTRSKSQLNFQGKLEFKQGSFVRLVGEHGQGKSTLLKVLSGVLLPSPEELEDLENGTGNMSLFVPPHLQVLHVASAPLFFKASLYWNMTIGVRQGSDDGSFSRVERVLRRLGVAEHLVSMLHSSEAQTWKDTVSHAESTLLCVGRALIANPDIICVERHWMGYDEVSTRIIALLREHQKYRGVEMDSHTLHLRRPRTVIMTCNSGHGHDEGKGDRTFHVSLKHGIKEQKPSEKDE